MSEQIPWDEFGAIMKEMRHDRRAKRLARTAGHLQAPDVRVVERFSAEHMRIEVAGRLFDFWPSTGRWRRFPQHIGHSGTGGIPAMRKDGKS